MMDSELQEKKKKHETESAADLERVTDYAEEKEIDVEDIKSALANLSQTMTTKHAKREKEVAQVVISKEDVELIVKEMEISKTLAEKSLRENRGSVVEALTALVNS